MIKIFINFITDGEGKFQIDEPDGFDASKFTIEQEEKRLGRDVLFAGGESNFVLNNRSNHKFDLVNKYFEIYGFEAEAELIFELENLEKKYDIDFATMTTNQVDTIKFKAVQKSKEILLKRRSDVNVDLLSDKDLDGNPITPCVPVNILIKAKPLVQISKWSAPPEAVNFAQGIAQGPSFFNQIKVIENSDITDTLTWLYDYSSTPFGQTNYDPIPEFTVMVASEDYKNLTAEIKLDLTTEWIDSGVGVQDAPFQIRGIIMKGTGSLIDNYLLGAGNPNRFVFYNSGVLGRETGVYININTSTVKINIGDVNRGEKVFFVFYYGAGNAIQMGKVTYGNSTLTLKGSSISYNTVNPAIRLYDAMKYICKSISGMDIDSPEYSNLGAFYDHFIFTGKFLRGITNQGFTINFEDIIKSIVETNSDYQIQTNDSVFFGTYKNFYASEEIAVIDGVQFEDYEKYFNERSKVNIFKLKYKDFQSQKENTIENTIDVVHGETEWLLKNKNVENKKEVEVEWVRDAFLIEETRKKAYTISETSVSQDDDKKFILDCRLSDYNERTFTTTSSFQHSRETDVNAQFLTLRSNGDINLLLLGISVGSTFQIVNPSPNFGYYTVLSITENSLSLEKFPSTNLDFSGIAFTEFQYTISENVARYINWTNQGFTDIQNIANGDNYSNLRFTVKRNIENYYSEYLATCNLFKKEEKIANTLYKNNPKAITTYNGKTAEEGLEFLPKNPILSPYEYSCQFRMSMAKYIDLENKIRDKRGYIRFIDNLGNVVRGYIKKADLTNEINEQGFLECIIEEKYQPAILNIFSDNITGIIIFNDDISVDSKNWSWTIDELDYLSIFDATGLLLFTPMHFSKVSVNGAIRRTRIELQENLNLL